VSNEDHDATADTADWRSAQRAKLVCLRELAAQSERTRWAERITAHLLGGFELPADTVLGFCWPYRNEYDARAAVLGLSGEGVTAALPEVTGKREPLQFRKWWPDAPMRSGAYGIPVPEGTEVVVPDVLLVPMNGFDRRGFRLGYGGGYIDRTIAALERRVVSIGVAYELARLDCVHPHAADVVMDFVVTEAGIYVAGGAPLVKVDGEDCRRCFAALLAARRLPRASCGAGYSSPVCYAAEFPEYFGGDGGGGDRGRKRDA
jgi:5,10-methenyltetrahydrofolate synthetase